MPTSEEKVAQIEAALKLRFFTFVSKIMTNRVGWTEEQHDTDRLSRALAAYALIGLCNIDEVAAVDSVTDGENDGGIDAFYFDRAGNRLVFVQSKFKRSGSCPSQDENNKTVNGIKALQRRRFSTFNQAFTNRLSEIEEAFDTPGIKIVLIHVFLGENFSPHVESDLNDWRSEMNVLSPCLDRSVSSP